MYKFIHQCTILYISILKIFFQCSFVKVGWRDLCEYRHNHHALSCTLRKVYIHQCINVCIVRKTVRISVTIRKDQKELLDRHREVNISGLLQKAIDEELWYLKEMDKEKLKIY